MSEQPRQEFDLRYPFRWQPDGGPCWCMSADAPHEDWIHSPLCSEMFRRWWAGSTWPLTEAGGREIRALAETAIANQVHPANWSHWVRLVMMAGPARDFIEMASPTLLIAMLDSRRGAPA